MSLTDKEIFGVAPKAKPYKLDKEVDVPVNSLLFTAAQRQSIATSLTANYRRGMDR
jgi:hypothetical protein